MSSRWKERNVNTRKDWKCEEENQCQSEEGALAWDRQLCLGQWQWTRRGWRQPQEVQWGRKESKRTSETPSGTWLGGAQRGSLWLCYAESLAEKRKSGVSDKRHRPKPIPWERNSLGNQERKKTRKESQRESRKESTQFPGLT